ncbi:MAG: 50S ribosomal protein L23 [Planctomycetota bacterium]
MEHTTVLVKPIVTEKSTWASSRHNAYTFEVHPQANKYQVKDAVEALYKVGVEDVRTIVRKGKVKRNRFGVVKKSDQKRAIVVLKEDDRIELF